MKRKKTWISGALFMLALSILACNCEEEKAPETWSVDRSAPPATPAEAEDVKVPEATPEVVEGGDLNGVFLAKDYDGLERVFITEKDGFSQADYNKGDDTIFMISVTDLQDEPDLRAKYAEVADKVAGHPYISRGKGSMVLVDGRFQVKLTSKSLDEAARKSHMEKIDFAKLPR